uniref:Uncharacterized protein n=1 Tax=Chenopodium quinoa TaxID=63459 RepID=A0A803N6A2_CHEQI
MATPLHFITSNNNDPNTTSSNTNTNQWSIINPPQPTNHHYPILKSVSNPKSRGRKSGNKSQNGPKNKTPQRGVGMAELERLRLLDEQHSSPLPSPCSDQRVSPSFHHSNNPISGVPLIRYCLPGQPVSDPRLTHRVGIPESASAPYYPELPSMPNPSSLDHSFLTSFKKKRVIGEETIGFSKGYNGHFGGFDLKNGDNYNQFLAFNNGGFSVLPTTTSGSE